jgi:hypothetical protein
MATLTAVIGETPSVSNRSALAEGRSSPVPVASGAEPSRRALRGQEVATDGG